MQGEAPRSSFRRAIGPVSSRPAKQGIEMPQSRKIIIDTDPGQDDAVAILLALGSSELEIVGITAVAGNVPLKLTQNNARKICELAGRPEIKVYAGAIRPL